MFPCLRAGTLSRFVESMRSDWIRRLRVSARLALLRGDPATAGKSYAELAARYPNDPEILIDLAGAQGAGGELTKAVESLEKATTLDRNDPRGWFLLGKNAIQMGDAARALNDYLVRALTLQNQLHSEPGQAETLNAMGVAHHELGQYAEALEKYSTAAAIRHRLGDQRGLATSLKNRARVYVAMGRFDEAEPDLRQARLIYEKIGDKNGLAGVLDDLGVLHEGRGDFLRARASYEEALKIRRDLGDERQLAQSYDNVGYALFLAGQYDDAIVYSQQGLEGRTLGRGPHEGEAGGRPNIVEQERLHRPGVGCHQRLGEHGPLQARHQSGWGDVPGEARPRIQPHGTRDQPGGQPTVLPAPRGRPAPERGHG